MKRIMPACLLFLCGMASAATCSVESRIELVLHGGPAFLVGSQLPELRIVDAGGRLLWSAAATGTHTQRFAGMTAGFTGSLAAIDIDGDGTHDRIYAGDLQGRMWRFDLDSNAPVSRWMTGGVFADLGNAASGRGFLAAPDITLLSSGGQPWISIAIGTANTAPATTPGFAFGMHRFYVLRDESPFERWTQRQYDRWTPLLEANLVLVEGDFPDAQRAVGSGYYMNLGAGQVPASSLTLNGRTFFTVVHSSALLLPSCPLRIAADLPVPVSVGSFSIPDLQVAGPARLPHEFAPHDSGIRLVRDPANPGALVCAVGADMLPGCSLDITLHRTFWRREDAD